MTILLTGGAGFLGSRVVQCLTSAGPTIRCLVRSPNQIRAPEVDVVVGDLQDAASLERACAGVKVVLHLAAAMGGSGAALVANNVVGAKNLASASRDAGVERFINVSSLAVYDADEVATRAVVDERVPIERQPGRRDAYAYSKIKQETVVAQALDGTACALTQARPGVIYGPGKHGMGTRIGLKYAGVLIRVGGARPLPYVFVDNCAAALALLATQPEPPPAAVNIVDDDVPTAADLTRRYRRQVGRLLQLPIPSPLVGAACSFSEWYNEWSGGQVPAIMTHVDRKALWGPARYSNQRLKEVGWTQTVPLPAALDQTFAT